ncbi:MAG TPA: hypothetical protein VFT99_07160 [Roseiflexaceae bacterium]|jgi:hypothetical protein|nr:hypothetical protein [Roseiflexaceae bacterium]
MATPRDSVIDAVWQAIATARAATPPVPPEELARLLRAMADVLEQMNP